MGRGAAGEEGGAEGWQGSRIMGVLGCHHCSERGRLAGPFWTLGWPCHRTSLQRAPRVTCFCSESRRLCLSGAKEAVPLMLQAHF